MGHRFQFAFKKKTIKKKKKGSRSRDFMPSELRKSQQNSIVNFTNLIPREFFPNVKL